MDGLATIQVDGGALAAPSTIIEEAYTQLGAVVAFLRVAAADIVEVEWLAPTDLPPNGYTWRCRRMIPVVNERPPWQRPGWLTEIMPDVDRQLLRAKLNRTDSPAQVRHTSVTGMLSIPTDRCAVWLKASLSIFAHEAAVIQWLSDSAEPDYSVPRVLSANDEWWLAEGFPEEDIVNPADLHRPDPLISLAKTQIATASRVEELRALGCKERPIVRLADDVSQLAERSDLLDTNAQRRLRSLLTRLHRVCEDVDALGFPAALVHGDVSPGNVRWTGTCWLIYDWTDSCITHPFVELASPLSYESDPACADSRARAFASEWSHVVTRHGIERALKASSIIGAAHQATSYCSILDAIEPTAADQASGERLIAFIRFWTDRLFAALG